jgi:hypothetical protein
VFESAQHFDPNQINGLESLNLVHRLVISHGESQISMDALIPQNQIRRQKTAKIGLLFVTQIDFECQGTLNACMIANHYSMLDGLKVLSLEHILKA